MASTPFQIPGNIKQHFLPFVLNKGSQLNQQVKSSSALTCSPQVFSFKTNIPQVSSGSAKLNICPTSFEQFMNKDISNKLLFSKENVGQSITFSDMYNSIPSVQIREFLPDTRLDQALNIFGDFIGKIMEILNATKKPTSNEEEQESDEGFLQKIKNMGNDFVKTIQHAWNFMTGTTQPTNLFMKGGKSRYSGIYNNDMYNANSIVSTYVMDFPWLMYYKLQSSVTTNIYEIPCKLANNTVITSDGAPGWTGDSIFEVQSATSKIPLIGGLLDKFMGMVPGLNLLQNIRINYMPYWDSKGGSKTPYPEIQLTFDLYNDSEKAAYANFIFINTIAPNNRWIQYNMFQHSPCLYDVKIDGLNRLYACSSKVNVAYTGVLRDPPDVWIENLIKTYGNTNVLKSGIDTLIKKNKMIKIPDIYTVTLTFQSLLPNNFNNYIFSYSQNINSLEKYAFKTYDSSMFTQVVTEPVGDFWKEMKVYVQSKGYDAPQQTSGNTVASYT